MSTMQTLAASWVTLSVRVWIEIIISLSESAIISVTLSARVWIEIEKD